jgi:hypothetical protein
MRRLLLAPILIGVVAFAGCGSSGKSLNASNGTATQTSTPTVPDTNVKGSAASSKLAAQPYHPQLNPSGFTSHITNQYFPLIPGRQWTYTGRRDGVPNKHVLTVTNQTKTILGVPNVVVQDVVTNTADGSLIEKTTDWYSQDRAGSIWYFGENTAEYTNNVVTSTAGTWEAGVDNALPGIVIHGTPQQGQIYRQEYRPGVAEDIAKVLTLHGSIAVPFGHYNNNVVETLDTDPLDPAKLEHKWYVKGIGFVHAVRKSGGHVEQVNLVKMTG